MCKFAVQLHESAGLMVSGLCCAKYCHSTRNFTSLGHMQTCYAKLQTIVGPYQLDYMFLGTDGSLFFFYQKKKKKR